LFEGGEHCVQRAQRGQQRARGSVVDTTKMIALCLAEKVQSRDEILSFKMRLENGKPVAASTKR
jgi:hypothetical protein